MNNSDIKKVGAKKLSVEIATHTSDPNYYAGLGMLPNPDTVLRKLNRAEDVFDAMYGDAHVMGELRSVRSGLLKYEWRVQAGGDSNADMRAFELCEFYMKNFRPAPGLRWADAFWNMGMGVFYGRRIHEVVWNSQLINGYRLPLKVVDRPNRRFIFNNENELRLLTRNHMTDGEPVLDKKFLLTRHMPSITNPYGMAVFSACFWPYIFKHAGFKFYSKFVEKYGIPWVGIEMPPGATVEQMKEAVELAGNMIEDAVAAFPQGGSASLIETKSSGKPVQEPFINLCNREISKALTSQTLATEIQGEGSRAASETHRDREQGVHESDREIICDTINELFAWMTEVNIGDDATPPTFEFYQEEEVQKDVAEFIDTARKIVRVPSKWAYDMMQIPMPDENEEVLDSGTPLPTPPPGGNSEFSGHSCPKCSSADFAGNEPDELEGAVEMGAAEADAAIADFIGQAKDMLVQFEADGKTLPEYRTAIDLMLKGQPDELAAKVNDALMASMLKGAEDAG